VGKNKKPRKQHKARAVHVPMMPETRDRMALSMHMAVEALILEPSIDTYNSLSTKLCTLSNVGIDTACLRTASQAVQEICDRFERVVVEVGQEIADVIFAAGSVDDIRAVDLEPGRRERRRNDAAPASRIPRQAAEPLRQQQRFDGLERLDVPVPVRPRPGARLAEVDRGVAHLRRGCGDAHSAATFANMPASAAIRRSAMAAYSGLSVLYSSA